MAKCNGLAIDIGNSQISLGWFDGEEIVRIEHRPSYKSSLPEIVELVDQVGDGKIFISSVVPELTDQLKKNLLKASFVLRPQDVPLIVDLPNPEKVGIDRLINAFAALKITKKDTIVVSLGTAITIDFVSGNGVFLGGMILPGVQTMLDALSMRGALLPQLQFETSALDIGKSTVEAMLLGVQVATEGGVLSGIERLKRISPHSKVILTGGWSEKIAPQLHLEAEVIPDLLLRGIVLIGSLLNA